MSSKKALNKNNSTIPLSNKVLNKIKGKGLGLPFSYLGFSGIWVFNCLTIMRSYWSGDDWPNSQTPYWIQWRYGGITNWNIWTEAMFWNNQWMIGAGRFYPVHWIESRFVFSYLRELWQYKTYQTLTLALAGFIFIYVIFKLSRSHFLTVSTLASLSVTVQFRRDFDPHIAFAAMLPTLFIRVFVAAFLAYLAGKAKREIRALLFSIASGIIFFLGMATYEFGFLLFPVLLISYLIGSEKNKPTKERENFYSGFIKKLFNIRAVPIWCSWILYGVYVFGFLRPRATSISGTYVLGISWKSIPVFLSQAFMGLPGVALRSSDFNLDLNWFIPCVLASVIVHKASRMLFKHFDSNIGKLQIEELTENKPRYLNYLLVILALNLIFAPGLMMSLQKTWWGRADFTHSYLGVMITEFGTALLIAIVVNQFFILNFKPKINFTKRRKK